MRIHGVRNMKCSSDDANRQRPTEMDLQIEFAHGLLAVRRKHSNLSKIANKPRYFCCFLDGIFSARTWNSPQFYGKRPSLHQWRPRYQTGTQVLTGFQDRAALMAEVFAHNDLSVRAGMSGKTECDVASRAKGSDFPGCWRQILSGPAQASHVAVQPPIAHLGRVRDRSSDAYFRDIKKARFSVRAA